MTHPLRQEIDEELYEILNTFHFEAGGHKPNDFRPTMNKILALIDKARKEAVEEIGDKLELVVDSYDGKYYWGLTEDAYDELFTPTPNDSL